jgi:hypothetical protein
LSSPVATLRMTTHLRDDIEVNLDCFDRLKDIDEELDFVVGERYALLSGGDLGRHVDDETLSLNDMKGMRWLC